mmetsp:Transcript_26044/g.41913  ORF Transcript_26044/g.41913 Transcript_26044/m.41913 type:complete len:345 (+) Transcript_26044:53-1087(+)|eukprot:jgi/Bigna1/88134/estExt_fgenesh1_pg.C_280150
MEQTNSHENHTNGKKSNATESEKETNPKAISGADMEEDKDTQHSTSLAPGTTEKTVLSSKDMFGEDTDDENDEDEDEDEDDSDEGEEDEMQTSSTSKKRRLMNFYMDDDEDEDEDDDDFDPDNPHAGADDSGEDSSSNEFKKADPVAYIPAPPVKRLKTLEDGKSIQVLEEGEEEHCAKILQQSTKIIAKIMSFLSLKEKIRNSAVCCAWNTPLVNFFETKLDFARYPQLTDRQVESILSKFGQMILQVRMDGCRNLTDRSIEAITIHCPVLQSFSMNRCFGITDEGVRALVRCQRLRYLQLWGVKNVTISSIEFLEKNLGDLVTPIHSCHSDVRMDYPTQKLS